MTGFQKIGPLCMHVAIDRFVVTLQLENTKLRERLKQLQDVVQPCSLSQTCGVSIVFWSSKYTT